MRTPDVDDVVRLTTDIPEVALHRGDVGVVRSMWFAPTAVYEVEFHQFGYACDTRTLCRREQLEIDTVTHAMPVA